MAASESEVRSRRLDRSSSGSRRLTERRNSNSPFKQGRNSLLTVLRQKFTSKVSRSREPTDSASVTPCRSNNVEVAAGSTATLCSSWRSRPRHMISQFDLHIRMKVWTAAAGVRTVFVVVCTIIELRQIMCLMKDIVKWVTKRQEPRAMWFVNTAMAKPTSHHQMLNFQSMKFQTVKMERYNSTNWHFV
jgi:hypothetical protein